MLLHRVGIALLVFFFNLQAYAHQNEIHQDKTHRDESHQDEFHQDCVFPKPIEPVLPDIYIAEERVTGLDAFWAQEYVGADILRKKLAEASGIKEVTRNLLQIWDSNNHRHGEHVSQIIAGPFPSAVIPQFRPIAVTKIPKH